MQAAIAKLVAQVQSLRTKPPDPSAAFEKLVESQATVLESIQLLASQVRSMR